MRTARLVTAVIVAILARGAAGQRSAPAARPSPPAAQAFDARVVSTAWLAAHLRDPDVVVLQVEGMRMGGNAAAGGRIPGARDFPFPRVAVRRGTLNAELPSVAELRETFEALGVSDATRVVVAYAGDAPSAARVLVALDYLGHDRASLLDGGLARWRAEGRVVTPAAPPPAVRGTLHPRPRPDVIATAPWIAARLGRPGLALVDTRTDGEYQGTAERHGMPSAGHLAGARQLQWEQLFQGDGGSAGGAMLKPAAELRRLFAERMQPGDTVVTYCWVGYRASATYVAARALGLPVRLYDGSYEDWSQQKRPVREGPTP